MSGAARKRKRPREPVKILFIANVCSVGINSFSMRFSSLFVSFIISYPDAKCKQEKLLQIAAGYDKLLPGDEK